MELGEVDELFTRAHPRIEAALLGHVADPAPRLEVDGFARPQDLAPVGEKDAEDDAHRCRLAGSVAADETEDLSSPDLEAEVVHCEKVAITLGEAAQLESGVRHARKN